MGFYEQMIEALNRSLREDYDGKTSHMGKACGVHPTTLKRLLDGERSTWAQMLGRVADAAGLQIGNDPAEQPQTREVCFVHADSTLCNCPHPPKEVEEDYLAVPMASEPVAAGPGIFPEDEIKGWVLVWRHHPSVRFKTNLVAVQVGRNERSMLPLFSPGDILLIDKDDRDPQPPGKAMLICEPDGASAVKRVSVTKDDGDYSVTFYSDNAKEFPPRSYKLRRDYDGDITKAIAGRVVWAWSDVRDK